MRSEKEFDTVYTAYFPKVYAYYSTCFGADAADDLAQQCFLQVWQGMQRQGLFRPLDWKAWVFRIAVNVKNDYLRQKYAKAPQSPLFEQDRAEDLSACGDADITERIAIETALSRLPFAQKELLLLRGSGLSSREIGKVLGINASTVRTRLAKAKQVFEEQLQTCGVRDFSISQERCGNTHG